MTNIVNFPEKARIKFKNPDRLPKFLDLTPFIYNGKFYVVYEELSCGRGHQPWYFDTANDAEDFIKSSIGYEEFFEDIAKSLRNYFETKGEK
jgi:hypothetical protein